MATRPSLYGSIHVTHANASFPLQPFIEEGQPILWLFPRREIAVLGVAFLILLTCCVVTSVIGLQLLLGS